MPAGRPRKFKSVEELEGKIEAYFEHCDSRITTYYDKEGNPYEKPNPIPYSVVGMCVFLDVTRETLRQYEELDEFSDTIKKAKQRVEADVVEGASEGRLNAVFSIFNLKNNFDWKDKQEVESKNENNNKTIIEFVWGDPSGGESNPG